jgi:zinc protease
MRTLATTALAIAAALLASSASADDVKIPFTKTQLPNGLTVILSEDHSVPRVVVNTIYGVGSRMEKPGRTGFAHLFEHLMFMGTRRAPHGMFDAWMEGGGGQNNANTAEDRTDYYDIGPSTELPLLLWLEADRIRDLGNLIDKDKLDLQRDVVRNERRQSIENRPYGIEELELPKLAWPESHPYHHPVIGSHEDLEAASVDDVKDFFKTWYDPANASLVVAGDFDPKATADLIQADFAGVPTVAKPADPGAPGFVDQPTTIKGVVRETVPDQVELTKITLAWQSPRSFAPGDADMDLLASVLSKGKESRLYKSLVYDQKIAQEIQAYQESMRLGSMFMVSALVRPGVDPAKVEKALFTEVGKLRDQPVSAEELDRARNGYEMGFVDGLQGIERRASLLNEYQVAVGDPGYAQTDLNRYRSATAAELQTYAKKVLLPDAVVVLTIVPKQAPDAAPAKKAGGQ